MREVGDGTYFIVTFDNWLPDETKSRYFGLGNVKTENGATV